MTALDKVNEYLNSVLPQSNNPDDGLNMAMSYSLMAGGKRIRPLLALKFSKAVGGNEDDVIPVACAVEMIHTYSLIHDDLPCMDNDDFRRGKPTNHKIYGECTATLAGDALQSMAFSEIMASKLPNDRKVKCAQILADASGAKGMCLGQYLDMIGEGKNLTAAELDKINRNKTGALLAAACKIGVAAAGGSDCQFEAAESFGYNIGLAFQIRDDILDVISSQEELGKNIGSDARENKNTYMALLGREKCEAEVVRLTDEAISALKNVDGSFEELIEIANYLINRKN